MLTISKPMTGADCGDYYLELAQGDYYTNAHEEPGRWFGQGAALLELDGEVSALALKNLLEGRSVDGRQAWVQNAGDAKRQKAWDLTFSAPKAPSVLWALSPEDVRRVIEQCHQEAFAATLTYIEETAGITRRGKGGRIKEKAALIFAAFPHTTSRAQDPQLHTHVLLINLGLRRDGTTGSLQTLDVFRLKMTAGAMYRREFAARLEQRLGLTIEFESVGFHIRGVPKGLCELFSKRSRTIKIVLKQRGQTGAVAAKIVALITRMRKQRVPRSELFAAWRAVADTCGWSTAEVRQLIRLGQEQRLTQGPTTGASEARDLTAAPHPTPQTTEQSRPADRQGSQASGADKGKSGKTQTPGKAADRRGSEEQASGQSAREERAHAQDNAGQGRRRQSGQAGTDSRNRRGPGHDERQSEQQQQTQTGNCADDKIRTKTNLTWRDPLDLPFIRIERRPLFPNAPFWSPAKGLNPPRIVIGRPPRPRWVKVQWRKDLVLVHFRVQQRRVFRRAPKWNPLHNLTMPSLRFAKVPQIPKDEAPHTWGSVLWEKELGPLALRVQKRRLFPRVYRSTRAGRLELPALRIVRAEQQQQHSH